MTKRAAIKFAAIAAVGLVGIVSEARASAILTDNFDSYSTSSSLAAQNGSYTTSVSSPNSVSGSDSQVVAGSLTYDGSSSSGNSLYLPAAANSQNYLNWRVLPQTYGYSQGTSTIWVGFLMKLSLVSSSNRYTGVSFDNSASTNTQGGDGEVFFIGDGSNQGKFGITTNNDSGSPAINSSYNYTSDTSTHFLVAGITFSATTESVNFWVDPNPSLGTPSGSPNSTLNTNTFSFNRIRLSSGSGSVADNTTFDDLAIGTSYSDVTAQFVPEPAAIGVLAAAAVGAMLRRKRHA